MSDKRSLIGNYMAREPKQFIQYDAFNPATYPAGPGVGVDNDGDELWAGWTEELMHGSQCRVLIPTETDSESVVRMLRKIADWIEVDGLYEIPAKVAEER